jgi:hypothetical protein
MMQLVIAPYTIYLFSVGGFISLVWCFVALIASMQIQTPNFSLYPEIDIAARVTGEKGYDPAPFFSPRSFAQLLWPLRNAGSAEVRRRLALTKFFVRFSTNEYDGTRGVVLTLEDNGLLLSDSGKGKSVEEPLVEPIEQ